MRYALDPDGSEIAASLLACEDVSQPKEELCIYLAWIAPSSEGPTQVAVVGIGKCRTQGGLCFRRPGSSRRGGGPGWQAPVLLSNLLPRARDKITKLRQLVDVFERTVHELNSIAGGMIDSISTNPDSGNHQNHRRRPALSPARCNHPGRLCPRRPRNGDQGRVAYRTKGKPFNRFSPESIDSLRPAEKRPPEPLPRVWYNYALLSRCLRGGRA